ncbi:IclR family transcriptional regulator [Peribacillus sp. NPDC096540]|uniref:IclR family transcriptional regulator n=1 Tax=Peribacillus sp. NPDC096540 TaxID=3390612 RepID=UPI003D02F6A4
MKSSRNSSIENALIILKSFSMDEPEMGITEIAERCSLAKSTVHRLLTTMASEGFVYKDPNTNRYSLGVSILALTNTVNSQLPILKDSMPILNLLTERTGESSHLGILEDKDIIYLQKIESEFPVEVLTHLGKRNPPHCTSTGQVILAYETEQVVNEVLSGELKAFTPWTLTHAEDVRKKLIEVKRLGYSVSDQEFKKGIISIGAPVFGEQGKVIASISITGPVERIGRQSIQKDCIKEAKSAAKKLTEIITERKMSHKTH